MKERVEDFMIWRQAEPYSDPLAEPYSDPLVISTPMSDDTKRICECAITAAIHNGDNCLATEHLLKGIAMAAPNQALDLLHSISIAPSDLITASLLGPSPFETSSVVLMSPYAERALKDALKIATTDGRDVVEPIDLLLALVREREGVASEILCRLTNALNQTGR